MHPLKALADGDLTTWPGIPPGAGVGWAQEAFPGEDLSDDGGYLLVRRGGVAGADGMEIWLGDARAIELVQLPLPQLGPDAVGPLGEPELELPSGWSRGARQLAWPGRGLAVHLGATTIVRVLGFAPMAADVFRTHHFATMGRPPRR